jgi:hypothetical protein
MDSHGKGAHDLDFVLTGESVEEYVVAKSALFTPFGVSFPRPSFVLVCFSTNCYFTGSQSNSKVSHKVILLGRGTILNCCGS